MSTIRGDLGSYVIAHDETQAHVLAPGEEVPDGVTIHPDLLEPDPEDPEDPGDDGAGGEDNPPASPKTTRRSSRARKS
jgi:hypothetical protein